MKNKILKISLSSAAIAAVVTPIATLTSCNKVTPVDPVDPVTPEQEKIFNIKDNTVYGFKPGVTQQQIKDYCKNGVLKLPAVKTIAANSFNVDLTDPTPFVTTIEIAAATTKIEDKAFFGATATSVTFTGGVATSQLSEIGNSAFAGCAGLTSFAFPAGLYAGKIDKSAFYGCTSLTELDLSTYATSHGSLTKPNWAYGAFTGTPANGHVIINDSISTHNRALVWSRLVYAGIKSNWHQYKSAGAEYDAQYKLLPWEYLDVDGTTLKGAKEFFYPESNTDFNMVEIPSSVDTLASDLNTFFKNRPYVTIWDLSDTSITAIPDGTFEGCVPSTTITGEKAKISLPNGLTTVGASAFKGCKYNPILYSQTEVLSSIGANAFDGSAIDSITLPKSLSEEGSIGESAFANCTSLKDIYIDAWDEVPPWTATGIFSGSGTSTAGANKVHMITLTDDPVGTYILKDQLQTYLTTGGLVFGTAAGEWKFDPEPAITLAQIFNIDNTGAITGWAKNKAGTTELTKEQVGKILAKLKDAGEFDGTLTIPSKINDTTVTAIADNAFYDATNSVTKMPTEVTGIKFASDTACAAIGTNAFRGIESLTSLQIPKTVTGENSVGEHAFSNCRYLGTLDLSDWEDIPYWGSYKGTIINDSGYSASNRLIKVKNYRGDNPTSSTEFDQWRLNSRLYTFLSGHGLWGIQYWTWDHVDQATPFNIENNVITGIVKGTHFTDPITATDIRNLNSQKYDIYDNVLYIPKTITAIADNAFINTETVESTIPGGQYGIHGLMFQEDSACTSIGKFAFAYNPFTAVTIPATLTSLGDGAFYAGQLETLTFAPRSSDLTIGASAFADNASLASIVVTNYSVSDLARLKNTTKDMLDNIKSTGKIKTNSAEPANVLAWFCDYSNSIALGSGTDWTTEI